VVAEVRTAVAALNPCQLYAHTAAPVPARTQHHHRYPQYLQERIWGEVRLEGRNDMLWLCGLCHDNIHEVLGWMLGESRKPNPMPGRNAVNEAKRTVEWYESALKSP
jgi:hypothetical protein